jgi:hypothetical protein
MSRPKPCLSKGGAGYVSISVDIPVVEHIFCVSVLISSNFFYFFYD